MRVQRQCRIRPQRGVLRHHPAVAHLNTDRVAFEIVLRSCIGLTHHIKMALQNHTRHRLATRLAGFSKSSFLRHPHRLLCHALVPN